MGNITQFGDYDEGVVAGQSLLDLFKSHDGYDISNLEEPSKSELDEIFNFIWSVNIVPYPYPALQGFLTTILRKEQYSPGFISIWGASDLIDMQDAVAPICEIPRDSGIIQFAEWTGECEDGDGWCIDIRRDRLCCIPASAGSEDPDQSRFRAYGIIFNLHYFAEYLGMTLKH